MSAPQSKREALTTYHLLIRHPRDVRVLAVRDENNAPALPTVNRPADAWLPSETEHLTVEIRNRFGIRVVILHEATRDDSSVVEAESLDAPPNLQWLACDQLPRKWHKAATKPVHPLRGAWELRGFFTNAVDWSQARLDELKIKATGAAVQVKGAWAYSTVIRLPTSGGDVYFKAVSSSQANEPLLLKRLAQRSPRNVPELLASDDDRRWMLMRDFGGTETHKLDDHHHLESMKRFAEIQLAASAELDAWRGAGCQDRLLECVACSMDDLIADPVVARGVNAAELERLTTIVHEYRGLFEELTASGLPNTLVNQDFRIGNVVWSDDRYVFYDWADSVITHPFFSATRFLNFIHDKPPLEANARHEPMIEAYLEPWQAVLAIEKLRKAFALARRINAMYQAVRFHLAMRTSEPMIGWEECLLAQVNDVLVNESRCRCRGSKW